MKPLKEGLKSDAEVGEVLMERANKSFHHVRYVIIMLGGFVVGSMYFARLSISVAMLSMVNRTHLYLLEHPIATTNLTSSSEEEALKEEEETIDLFGSEDGEFEWSNERQQLIIASYMLTYTLPQLYTTKLGLIYGIRWVAFLSLSLCGLSCLLLPVLVYVDWRWAMALRMVNGLGASGLISIMIIAIERWFPKQDAPKGVALLQFVQASIVFIIPLITGELTAIHWKWGYYAPGAVCLLFALVWFLVVRDSPQECPFVSQQELEVIERILENENEEDKQLKRMKREQAAQLPWWFMFKIPSFYVCMLIWCLYNMGNGGTQFLLPTYFQRVFHVSVEENGVYNFLIHIGILFSMLWPNPLIQFLQRRFQLSLTAARTWVVLIYSSMCSLTSLHIALFHDSQVLLLAIFKFFHITNELIMTSVLMSQYSDYGLSGPVFSMINTIGNLVLALFCWSVGKLLDYTGESLECWSWVFTSIALMNGAIFFLYWRFVESKPVDIRIRDDRKQEA